ENTTFKFLSATLLRNDNSSTIKANYLRQNEEAASLSGIIALNKELISPTASGKDTPIAIQWRTEQITLTNRTEIEDQFSDASSLELGYRYSSYKSPTNKRAAQSFPPLDTNSLLIALLFGFLAG